MKYYDPFVLPFVIGLYFIFVWVFVKCTVWIVRLDHKDKMKLVAGLFNVKIFSAAKEIFFESLLHRKIFRVNPWLGYMHMSLAFGWFLLILFGKIGTLSYSQDFFNPLHYAIFFKFFEPENPSFFYSKTYYFVMDAFLFFILTGLCLAIVKRFRSGVVGMKRTTHLRFFDKLAITTLWMIFPMRFLAESFTGGLYHNGHFLTGTAGELAATYLPVENLVYPAWWAYSLTLGLFFIALPNSRYMHIPAEMFLILVRKFGIGADDKSGVFAEVEVLSCSRCGICIDTCQMTNAGVTDAQSVYFIRAVRDNKMTLTLAMNCLQCGRCKEKCPVGIDLENQRYKHRKQFILPAADFSFMPSHVPNRTRVIYFAGCMTHLTPGIKTAMVRIFADAGEDFYFMDEGGGACCGRPLILAGDILAAQQLIEYNRKIISDSGASLLVASCPICYRVFKEDYHLGIEVLHHSQYMLKLIREGRLLITKQKRRVVYHDPCELGRGSNIYDEPREILKKLAELLPTPAERSLSLCCGNSIANLQLDSAQVKKITSKALEFLTAGDPDILATSCPLCKKTFAGTTAVPVSDIAEIIADSIITNRQPINEHQHRRAYKTDVVHAY